ncbi:MAG TPA: alpha/beta hydrolase [Candidatus Hydrogenedentes bacterium]|nr:alpha/beta hydrolase [Candidatus Hydrogenedentota bacterium]HOL75922.1 alpha/beta hydrolase [Candidatus Hydrogenedentota bacterium]HPO85669.1 alpha/beta hydrolase [Candidatus Hydrogenedentota bacterium]
MRCSRSAALEIPPTPQRLRKYDLTKVKKEMFVYRQVDRCRLKMNLFYQPGAERFSRPGILLIHGGAWTVGSRVLATWYARKLAEAGYVAAAMDYRKMPQYPFPACLDDAKAALEWLIQHATPYGLDPGRIAVMGDSAGGHLALLLASKSRDNLERAEDDKTDVIPLKAAIGLYPPSDLTYYSGIHKHKIKSAFTQWFMNRFLQTADNNKEAFASASPLYCLHPGMCPVLLVHGKRDSVVPWEQSALYFERSKKLGNPIQLVSFESQGHAFDYIRPHYRHFVLDEVLSFLRRQMAPVTAKNPQEQNPA